MACLVPVLCDAGAQVLAVPQREGVQVPARAAARLRPQVTDEGACRFLFLDSTTLSR